MNLAPSETCMFIDYVFPFGLTRGECASWVQAWGSILAIAFSVVLVRWQQAHQRDAKAREEADTFTRKLEYCFQLSSGAARVADNVVEFIGVSGIGSRDGQAALVEITAYCDAFRKFDPSIMRTPMLFNAALAADALSRLLKREIEELLKPLPPSERAPQWATRDVLDSMLREEQAAKARANNRKAVVAQLGQQLREQAETIAIELRERSIQPHRAELIRKDVTDAASESEKSQ